MPILPTPAYQPPPPFTNGHVQTIYAALFRRVEGVAYGRERIDTHDGDFLDLDWSRCGARRLAILSHGLEGNSGRSYVRGMTRALNRRGWDVLAWNYRGCSGQPNRTLRSYHSGATDDLDVVVRHALAPAHYGILALVGFSLGGNLTLKYLGERAGALDARIRGAVVFSVPCDLAAGATHLARHANRLYLWTFLRSLRAKIRAKADLFPGQLDVDGLRLVRTLYDFDDRYTAPLHGFAGAEDYWRRSSSRPFLSAIDRPTLLVSAADDPFLPPACYPEAEARASPALHLEIPRHGGHVGFVEQAKSGIYWSEARTADFLAAC
jgi:predicted alpha/beta-fold hydrolase